MSENFNTAKGGADEEVGIDEVLDNVEASHRAEDEESSEEAVSGGVDDTSGKTSAEASDEVEAADSRDADENASDGENDDEADEAGDDDEPITGSDGKIHTGLFGKKEKKDKRDTQIEELNDRVKRQMAEFENFRKRTEKEKTQMFDMGAKAIIEKILPVVDSFERGLAAVPEGEEADGFAEGMRMVYKQLTTALEQAGLTPIEAVGQTFDPEIHNAVMHIDDEAYGESEIVEELQKGYTYHDTVVRHSMVKVAN